MIRSIASQSREYKQRRVILLDKSPRRGHDNEDVRSACMPTYTFHWQWSIANYLILICWSTLNINVLEGPHHLCEERKFLVEFVDMIYAAIKSHQRVPKY
jgi:hypothetical protein